METPLLHRSHQSAGGTSRTLRLTVAACALLACVVLVAVAVQQQQQQQQFVPTFLDQSSGSSSADDDDDDGSSADGVLSWDAVDPFDQQNAFVFHGVGQLAVLAIDATTGASIPSANFEVHSADGATVFQPASSDGRFLVEVDAPMTYRVIVSAPGYATYSNDIPVDVDKLSARRISTVPTPDDNKNGYVAYIVLSWGPFPAPDRLDGVLRTPKCTIDPDSPQHCTDHRVKVLFNSFGTTGPNTIGIKEFVVGDYYYQVEGLNELTPFAGDARVTLFVKGQDPKDFLLGRDGFVHAPVWKVFRILNGGQGRFGAVEDCPNEACAFGHAPFDSDGDQL